MNTKEHLTKIDSRIQVLEREKDITGLKSLERELVVDWCNNVIPLKEFKTIQRRIFKIIDSVSDENKPARKKSTKKSELEEAKRKVEILQEMAKKRISK